MDAPREEDGTAVESTEGESSARFGRWTALTAVGFALAVWLSGRDR
jgi:hypothetical protein